MLASVPLIPKFASEITATVCELRNRDTSRSLTLAQKLVRRLHLRALGRPGADEPDQLLVVGLRSGTVAELFGGAGGADKAAEALRLLGLRGVKGGQRLFCHAVVQQHLAVELARWSERPWRYRRLLCLVLGVGG